MLVPEHGCGPGKRDPGCRWSRWSIRCRRDVASDRTRGTISAEADEVLQSHWRCDSRRWRRRRHGWDQAASGHGPQPGIPRRHERASDGCHAAGGDRRTGRRRRRYGCGYHTDEHERHVVHVFDSCIRRFGIRTAAERERAGCPRAVRCSQPRCGSFVGCGEQHGHAAQRCDVDGERQQHEPQSAERVAVAEQPDRGSKPVRPTRQCNGDDEEPALHPAEPHPRRVDRFR